MKNKKIRNDLILIISLLAIAVLSLVIYTALSKDGNSVSVIFGGEVIGEYPLSVSGEYEIRTGENNMNLLVIEDGKAFVKEASCPGGEGKRCTAQRGISKEGETIVCLPHKLVFAIEAK